MELSPANDVPLLPAALPLRRPRSPESVKRERRSDDSGSERPANPNHKFGPPGSANASHHKNPRAGPARPAQADDKPRPQATQDRPRAKAEWSEKPNGDDARNNRGNDRQSRDDGKRPNRPGGVNNRSSGGGDRNFDNRRPAANLPKDEEEEWGAKPAPKPESRPEPKPSTSQQTPAAPPAAPQAPKPEAPKPRPPAVQRMEPKLQPKAAKDEPQAAKPAAPDVVSSSRELVPKDSIVSHLSVGDTFTLAVTSAADAGPGFVCSALTEHLTEQYLQLLDDDFSQRCQASPLTKPKPGETFAYLNPEDGGWYRARCLNAGSAALLDGSKVVALRAGGQPRALPAGAAAVPEFSCLLTADNVQVADNLTCKVVSKSGDTLSATLVNIETGAEQGSGAVRRWAPKVDYPEPEPAVKPSAAAAAVAIPEVPRPALAHQARVVLLDATEPGRLFVRGAGAERQAAHDGIDMDVAAYGLTAVPLKEPPAMGQTVVAKFVDGVHYRALCRRVNSKLNKYLVEYIEYGNTVVAFLEDLYPCPPELTLEARPTLTSQATLQMSQKAFNAAAIQYLDKLKNESTELILSIPSGAATAPSGSAVRLTVAQSGEDVNRTVNAFCTPEWVKLMERGGDIMDIRAPVFAELTYVDLPSSSFELEVVDASLLKNGVIGGHERGAPHAARAFALADLLAEYCNSALCKDPYLPMAEELCVALCPTRNQWVRATLMAQVDGAGGADADLLLFDYGEVTLLPVTQLRKMMPEFVVGFPAASCSIEIKDFPEQATEEQVAIARRHMKINERGVGYLRVARAHKVADGEWLAEVPDLIRAMTV